MLFIRATTGSLCSHSDEGSSFEKSAIYSHTTLAVYHHFVFNIVSIYVAHVYLSNLNYIQEVVITTYNILVQTSYDLTWQHVSLSCYILPIHLNVYYKSFVQQVCLSPLIVHVLFTVVHSFQKDETFYLQQRPLQHTRANTSI